jgi:LemA protein
MTALYAGLGAVALVAAWLLTSYRGLASSARSAHDAWGGLEAQLRRRHDLVPALVAAVREHAPGESAALERLVAARVEAQTASTPFQRAGAERRLVAALGAVAALAQRHPALGGTGPFVTLQAQLADLEDEIRDARRTYNAEVRVYLARRKDFPGNLLRGFGDFPDRPYFEADPPPERLGLRLTTAGA